MTTRRLAAILVADVVSYTRLMAEDESATLTVLKSNQQEVIRPLLERCSGRMVKLMGDGALMEFASAVNAVSFAVMAQTAIAARNAGVPEERRVEYRVGIEVGDIVVEGDDIFGDGVNAASRLEALADPGGICVSNQVRRQIGGKLDLDFEDLGRQQVKNIAEAISVWRLVMNEKSAGLDYAAPVQAWRHKKFAVVAAGLIAILAVAGAGFLLSMESADWPEAALPVRHSTEATLIVLPFSDLSEDGSLGHFADGMTEDLITDLARWREIGVVARNSSNLYKEKSIDVREVAREVQADYVLEGSIRLIGGRLRVTAQLIDGNSGAHVWADRFDDSGADVLKLQDRVIQKIVQTLIGNQGVIRADEYAKTWAKANVNLEEYDYYLRGHDLFYRFTPEHNANAIAIWEEGLAKYPGSGLLKIKIGYGHMVRVLFGWAEDRDATVSKVVDLVEAGMADQDLPPAGHRFGLWLRATVSTYTGDYDVTIQTAKRVAEAYPFDSEGFVFMSDDLLIAGEVELAAAFVDRALELDRRPTGYMYRRAGQVRFAQGQYEKSIDAFEKTRENGETLWYLAASHAALDRMEKAAHYIEKLKERYPELTPEGIRAYNPWQDQEVPDRVIGLLEKAGWP